MLLCGAMDDCSIIRMGKVVHQMQNSYIAFTFSWYSYKYNCDLIGVLLRYDYFEEFTNVQWLHDVNTDYRSNRLWTEMTSKLNFQM